MQRYKMIDGTVYEGRTYEDVVAAMSKDKLSQVRSLPRYRKATARRVRDVYGCEVDPGSNLKFVRTLVKSGLMERVG